jgi:hypothetical protein
MEEANMVSESMAHRHRPMGNWNPRHHETFSNDLQVNLRSYFDRWREPEDPSGAKLPPEFAVKAKQRFAIEDQVDTFASPTQSAHRRQKAKATNASKLRVDWRNNEHEDAVADGTVMRWGPHKGKTFHMIVKRDPGYVKDCLKRSLVENVDERLQEWMQYLHKRYVLITHADGKELVIPSDTTIMQFGKHRGKTFKEITDLDPAYVQQSLGALLTNNNEDPAVRGQSVSPCIPPAGKSSGSHPQSAAWLDYLQGWYQLRREPDTQQDDGILLKNYSVDPIEVTTASVSSPNLTMTRSEGQLGICLPWPLAATPQLQKKLERQRMRELKDRGRAQQVELLRRSLESEKKRELAWFSSHGIHF